MQVVEVRDAAAWNRALGHLPHAHVLQTWEWGAFKARHGWTATRWLWQEGERPVAAASVLRRAAGWMPLSVLYVPKGPVLDYRDSAQVDQVLAFLETYTRQQRGLFVKLDPDVRADRPEGERAVDGLRRRGWRLSTGQVQFRNTMMLDLTQPADELLSAMKSKWRYNIRLAQRHGVAVREGTPEDLPLLFRMYAETARRDAFLIRPAAYYQDLWSYFMEAGLARPFIAEVEGEPVAMLILFHFAGTAWYMYGASLDLHRDYMPNHLLQWQAMAWAREQGCTRYDLWGAPDALDENDPLWGVYRFKGGFGAEFEPHIGAYDFPASRLGCWLYGLLAPRLLGIMRRAYWWSKL